MINLNKIKEMKELDTLEIGPLTMAQFDEVSGYLCDNGYVVGYNKEVFDNAVLVRGDSDNIDFLEKEEVEEYLNKLRGY